MDEDGVSGELHKAKAGVGEWKSLKSKPFHKARSSNWLKGFTSGGGSLSVDL